MIIVAIFVVFLFATVAFAGAAKKAEKPSGKIPKRVGWVVNYLMHEWYQNMTKGALERASMLGIELEIVDANLDMSREVALAEDLMAKGVDVIILTPVEQKGAVPILKKAEAEGIPVVVQASPVAGMKTLVTPCDYDGGFKGGVETGKYFKEHIGGKARVMAIDLPALRPCILRVDGFMDGLRTQVPDAELVHRLDGQGLKDSTLQVATDALTADPNINVIFGCNDDSALGALQAYRGAGLEESKLVVCGMGGEGMAFIYEMQKGGPYKVEAAMLPEKSGYECIEACVALYNNEEVPEYWITPTVAITPENLSTYYIVEGDVRKPIWDAQNAIPIEDECGKY